jgi:asparagine synthase (glutamine-hydrolysing)
MSAQGGIWSQQAEPLKKYILAKMSQSLAEYGPDGEFTFVGDDVAIVYRPFHTSRESRSECQPHISATGKVVTWNGRLDNREELISQLTNDLTGDHSDVALVAAAFERWGTDSLAKLIGDWALSVWNAREKELILARDYMGIRHLFYYPTPQRILWCSHLAPLALCGDQFTICDEYVAGYLAFYPDADLTPYREILSVPPGKFVRIRNGQTTAIQAYWNFTPDSRIRYRTDAEYEEKLRHLFRQSVRRRLRTDSPVLAELSGGLDSSSIVCMADEIARKRGSENPRVDTFSFCDRGEPDEDDFLYYTIVENSRGRTGHHAEIRGSGDTLSFERPRFAPAPDFDAREEVKISREAIIKDGTYRVILSGIGGDEFLGQALDPRIQMAELLVQLRIGQLTDQLLTWSLIKRRPLIQLFFSTLLLVLPTPLRSRMTKEATVPGWITSKFARRHKLSTRLLAAAEGSWFWLPGARDSFQTCATLARQMTQDPPTVEEIRYPYLDRDLVEFLLAIPSDQLLRPGEQRSLMRRSFADLLPPEVLNRRTKASTGRCLTITLVKHWERLEAMLCTLLASNFGYINNDFFRAALLGVKNGQLTHDLGRLVRGLSLECWLRQATAEGVISARPTALGVGTTGISNGIRSSGIRSQHRTTFRGIDCFC